MRDDKNTPAVTNIDVMMRKASKNTQSMKRKEDDLRELREKFRRALAAIGTDEAFAGYCEKYKITKNAREFAIAKSISKTKSQIAQLLNTKTTSKEFKSYADNPRVQTLHNLALEALELNFVENEDNQADDKMIQNTLRYIIRHSTNEANKVKAIESLAKYQQKTGDNATLARWRQLWTQHISPLLTMEMPPGGGMPQSGHSE